MTSIRCWASLATLVGVAAVMISFCHGLDALVTRHAGYKGIYPAST